jgi:hypothetical protein
MSANATEGAPMCETARRTKSLSHQNSTQCHRCCSHSWAHQLRPFPGMTGKYQIVAELGEKSLTLPNLVNAALVANDRAKYLIALLQAAKGHADHPETDTIDLRNERIACGINEIEFDTLAERSCAAGIDYSIPLAQRVYHLLAEQVALMIAPTHVDGTKVPDANSPKRDYQHRLDACLARLRPPDDDSIEGDTIDRIARVASEGEDSLHSLIMDLHKELNRLQREIATESIEGAAVYSLGAEDRPLVSAFMSGVHRTEKLKFDHPGLGTTATRDNGALVIQNDIGLTDAHVLVIRVEPPQVTITYTDVHIQRLAFFQRMLRLFAVAFNDTVSKRSANLPDLYHLSVAVFTARDRDGLTGRANGSASWRPNRCASTCSIAPPTTTWDTWVS